MDNIISYFKQGFSLANKSWYLFLIGLSITALGSILYLSNGMNTVFKFSSILLFPISLGFSFSLPVFLIDRQQGKPFDARKILSITLRNTKRLILPLILLFVAIVLLGILSFFVINQASGVKNINWDLVWIFPTGLLSFLIFTPIYFSIEKDGLLKSIKKSVSFSFRNLNLVIIAFVISVITYLLSKMLNIEQNLYQALIRDVIYQYEGLLVSAASLILYQNKKLHSGNNPQKMVIQISPRQ